MDVKVKITNKDEVLKIFTDENGFHIPTISMRALNLTADQVKAALVQEMQRAFDRPVPYTLGAPYVVKKATKNNLAVHVFLKDASRGGRSESYLKPGVYGSNRRVKAFEKMLTAAGALPPGMYVTPGERAPRDAYGNISPGFIVQVLAYFRAFPESGYRANMSDEKRAKLKKGTKKKRGIEYFAVGERTHGLAPGIYRRVSFGFGSAVQPMMMFVKRPSYSRILRWQETAQRVVNENWERNFNAASKGD